MIQFLKEFGQASVQEARWLFPVLLLILVLMHFTAPWLGANNHGDILPLIQRLIQHLFNHDPCGCM